MERILVADDNDPDRRPLRDALEHQGYGAEEAADGHHAFLRAVL